MNTEKEKELLRKIYVRAHEANCLIMGGCDNGVSGYYVFVNHYMNSHLFSLPELAEYFGLSESGEPLLNYEPPTPSWIKKFQPEQDEMNEDNEDEGDMTGLGEEYEKFGNDD